MKSNHDGTTNRIIALDGLRGFSALYVVIFHILHQPKYFDRIDPYTQSIIVAGASMVQVFFVISGYSISKSIFDLIRFSVQPKLKFILSRFFRIFPLWAGLLTLMLLQHQIEIQTFFANLFFFFGDMTAGSRLFPIFLSWSLQAEVIFYILAVFLMHSIFSIDRRNLFFVWIISIGTAQVWRLLAFRYFPGSYLPDGFFLAQMMHFVAGILIEKVNRDGLFVKTFSGKKTLFVMELMFVSCFLFFNFWDLNFLKIVLAPIFVILVLHQSSWLSRIMSMKIFVLLGTCSYGIYLLQDLARGHIGYWFNNKLSLPYELILSLGLTIFIAIVAHYLIEKPALALGQFLSAKLTSKTSH